MLRLIMKSLLPAIGFALGGNRTKWDQHVVEDQDDIGPLVTDDKSFAVIELLGVFRMQTGTMLARAVKENGHCPGQTFSVLPRSGKVRGLLLGEAL